MLSSFVMTVIGADRPGLIGRLSAVLADHQGNWLESRMAHLGGRFAGILRAQLPAAQEEQLLAALRALQDEGLTVYAVKDTAHEAEVPRALATLDVVGQDRPGIVREISQVLARHAVNVEELVTHCEPAPMSGEQMFHATATIQLPASCTTDRLREALEQIAADLMVDIAVADEDAG